MRFGSASRVRLRAFSPGIVERSISSLAKAKSAHGRRLCSFGRQAKVMHGAEIGSAAGQMVDPPQKAGSPPRRAVRLPAPR